MGVVVETLEEPLAYVLVDERVVGHLVLPGFVLLRGGELPVQQEVGHLEIGGILGQLLDRIAPVAQDAHVTVEIGDRALAGCRGHEPRVVEPDTGQELRPLRRRDAPVLKGDLEGLAGAVVGDRDALGHWSSGPSVDC
jgi:hypothetical protein